MHTMTPETKFLTEGFTVEENRLFNEVINSNEDINSILWRDEMLVDDRVKTAKEIIKKHLHAAMIEIVEQC